MKKLSTYIVLFISILMFTVSCIMEDTIPNTPDSKGGNDIVLDVSILSGPESTKASDPNVLNANEYAVERVRLYVFNNIGTAASPNYKFEKTELFTGNNILEKTESGCKVKIAVKEGLSKKIIVILNEPTRLTTTLNNYKTIKEINGIQFNMLDDYPCKPISWSRKVVNRGTTTYSYVIEGGIYSFFDSRVGDYVLPFYGASSDFVLINKPSNTITIPVKRAVARVDLYITDNDSSYDYYFAGYQEINKVNSDERHERKEHDNILLKNYNKTGMIAPVALLNPVVTNSSTSYTYSYSEYPDGGASMSKPWSEADDLDNMSTISNNAPTTSYDYNYLGGNYKINDTPTRICHIYVPEISDVSGFSLQTNSLQIQLSKISIKNVSTGEYLHDKVINIPDFIKLEKFTKLERNKVYKIYCTKKNGDKNISIDVKVSSWTVTSLGNKDLY